MAVFLFICGYAAIKEENILSFVSLCAFFMSSTLSQAVINWLYIAEVTVDAASGFCVAGKAINLLIVSFSFEYMINSPLQIHGTIWYYSTVTFVGFLFCLFFVKETMGLTENEKKTLYSPKSDDDIDVLIEMQENAQENEQEKVQGKKQKAKNEGKSSPEEEDSSTSTKYIDVK